MPDFNAAHTYNKIYDKLNAGYNVYYELVCKDESFQLIRFPYAFGVEIEQMLTLEALTKIHNSESEEIIEKLRQHWVMSGDGSVRRSKITDFPVEFKSQILFGDEGAKVIFEFFDMIKPKFNNSCGQHVHISSGHVKNGLIPKTLTDKEKLTLAIIGPVIESFVLSKYILQQRKASNTYLCNVLYSQAASLVRTLYEGSSSLNIVSVMSSHYSSISFSRYGTIEFRMLQGQSDPNFLIKMINLYMATLELSSKLDFDEAKNLIRDIFTKSGLVSHCNNDGPATSLQFNKNLTEFLYRAHLELQNDVERRIHADIRRRLISLMFPQKGQNVKKR